MAIRRFKQLWVYKGLGGTLHRFRKPNPEITSGTTVVLEYTDGTEDMLIVQRKVDYGCEACAYDKGACPAYIHNDGRYHCMFGEGLYAVHIGNVLEEL